MAMKVGLTARNSTELAKQLSEAMAEAMNPDVRFVSVDSVQLWKGNPWKHDNAVPRLAELLAINGQKSPVQVWRKNNTIYKGNHTKKALVYLGQNIEQVAHAIKDTVAGIRARITPELIKVEFTDFPSEAAAIAYGMADNNSGMGGEYDDDTLRRLLMVDEEYFTAKRTGFTEKELKAFKLSTAGGMDGLENVDLQGEIGDIGEFLILTFADAAQVARFKEAFSMSEKDRKMDFALLINAFNDEWRKFCEPDGQPANGEVPF
jgi:hypothetical protein